MILEDYVRDNIDLTSKCSLNVKAVSKDAYDGQGKTQCPVTRCH